MIVRINQLETEIAERAAGWDSDSFRATIERSWPDETSAYQLLILDHDEAHQPVPAELRRNQIRQMLPQLIQTLTMPDDHIVLRFDGTFSPAGLGPVFAFAADPEKCRRFSYSSADRLADCEEPPITSIRLLPRPGHLADLFAGARMNESVRLRAFGLPSELVDPLLDTADLDDERWRDLLPSIAFMVSTSHDLLSLLIWTSRFDADEIRQRITEHLGGRKSADTNVAAEQWS
jgi:hypothetical protein